MYVNVFIHSALVVRQNDNDIRPGYRVYLQNHKTYMITALLITITNAIDYDS